MLNIQLYVSNMSNLKRDSNTHDWVAMSRLQLDKQFKTI